MSITFHSNKIEGCPDLPTIVFAVLDHLRGKQIVVLHKSRAEVWKQCPNCGERFITKICPYCKVDLEYFIRINRSFYFSVYDSTSRLIRVFKRIREQFFQIQKTLVPAVKRNREIVVDLNSKTKIYAKLEEKKFILRTIFLAKSGNWCTSSGIDFSFSDKAAIKKLLDAIVDILSSS